MSKRGGFHFPTTPNADFNEIRSGSFQRGSDPDFLYYNAQIINNSTDTITTRGDPEIRFQDTRSVPILQDKSNYAISVENFTINGAGKDLPVFIPQIRQYNTDGSINTNPNNTVYDITLTIQYGGTKASPTQVYQSTRSVQWEPENQATWTTQPAPLGEFKFPQPEIDYYYCYSYNHWTNLVNKALALAWNDIITAGLSGSFPGDTIVVNSLNGSFTSGGLAQGEISGATANIVSFTGNTLVLSGVTGEFQVGETIFQEPDVATASITTISQSEFITPQIQLGTKCPFYTYDPKTNLFSLWQDANTCVTPFGTSISSPPFNSLNPPSALDVFGVSTATGYLPGEYSFIGYNTNFESLFTNFNTIYYSNQQIYPPSAPSANGVSINSPTGLESTDINTALTTDAATVSSFTGNTLTVTWSGSPNGIGTDWKFDYSWRSPSLQHNITVGSSLNFTFNSPINVYGILKSYTTFVTATASNGTVLKCQVQSAISNALRGDLDLTVLSATGTSGSNWVLRLTPLESDTPATPTQNVSLNLSIQNLQPGDTPIDLGKAVTAIGHEGQSFNGIVTDFTETFGYTGATGPTDTNFTYSGGSFGPGQFNPLYHIQGQSGVFQPNDVVIGLTSGATTKVIDTSKATYSTPNTITIERQTGPFIIGDVVTTDNQQSALITEISGPNTAPPNVVRTGLLTLSPTYQNNDDSKFYYSGPFAVGETIVTSNNPSTTSAVITQITGDNGLTTLSFSAQKNPFAIGHVVECQPSLIATGPPICLGTVVDIQGDNLGYASVNITDQCGKFGVGESIVDDVNGAVATIVGIQGDNNGYGYISYINEKDPANGVPSSFIAGENLLFGPDAGVAFAKVVVDTQNVLETNGNIGIVTVIVGKEVDGTFYTDANVPFPTTGDTITGARSGTTADYGGIVFKDVNTLIVNNICGTFYVGDMIYDTPGFGLKTTQQTTQVTAKCNGFSYLGTGKLILKNTDGGNPKTSTLQTTIELLEVGRTYTIVTVGTSDFTKVGASENTVGTIFIATQSGTGTGIVSYSVTTGLPATFPTNSFIVDYDSTAPSTATNPTVLYLSSIPSNTQFYQGNAVRGELSGARGTVILNNGPFPYSAPEGSSQLVTILLDQGSPSFEIGEVVHDDTSGVYLPVQTNAIPTGRFEIGAIVSQDGVTGNVISVVPSFPAFPNTIEIGTPSGGTFATGTVESYFPDTATYSINGKQLYWDGNDYPNLNSTNQKIPLDGETIINWNLGDDSKTATCNWSTKPQEFYVGEDVSTNYNIGDLIIGTTSKTYGVVLSNTYSPYGYVLAVKAYNGSFKNTETLRNLTTNIQYYNQISSVGDFAYSGTTPNTTVSNVQFISDNSDFSWTTGDSIGVLPYIYPLIPTLAANIIASGARITISFRSGTTYAVGDVIYFYNSNIYHYAGSETKVIRPGPASATGKIVNIVTPVVNGSTTIDVAFSAFAAYVDSSGYGVLPGISSGYGTYHQIGKDYTYALCLVTTTSSLTPNYVGSVNNSISKIEYYTDGFVTTNETSTANPTVLINDQSNTPATFGTLDSIITSPSSAFVQTSKPPTITTSLTLTNVSGSSFVNGDLIVDATTATEPPQPWSYANVTDYNETTINSQIQPTVLTLQDIHGTFTNGQSITDINAQQSASIASKNINSGSLILQALDGTLIDEEVIRDFNTGTMATYLNKSLQHITGSTGTAIVIDDNGFQLNLGAIVGTLAIGDTITSSDTEYTATLSGNYNFIPGTRINQNSSALATVVSDNGSQLVVNNVSGVWEVDQAFDDSSGVTATLSSISDVVLTIIPSSSTAESGSWIIVPQTLTSMDTVVIPEQTSFTTNLSASESIFSTDNTIVVSDVNAILPVQQLYYPENVVQVDLSAGNGSVQTLQSLFPSAVTGSQYVVLVQDMESTSSLWSPVASIVIGTQFITVREEYSGSPITIGNGNLGSNATTGSFQKVLLETPIEVLPQESWRGIFFYEPRYQKLSSLGLSKEDLKNLDVQVYWRNRLTNSLVPLTLYNGGSANIRLLFKRIHE